MACCVVCEGVQAEVGRCVWCVVCLPVGLDPHKTLHQNHLAAFNEDKAT